MIILFPFGISGAIKILSLVAAATTVSKTVGHLIDTRIEANKAAHKELEAAIAANRQTHGVLLSDRLVGNLHFADYYLEDA